MARLQMRRISSCDCEASTTMLDRSIKASTRLAARMAKRASPAPSSSSSSRISGSMRGGDGKTEPHQHAGRVGPRRQREVIAQFAEGFDLRHLSFDLVAAHAEQQAAGHDIFVTGVVGVEPRRGAEQRRHPAFDGDRALAWLIDAGENAQHRRLAGAVMPDDAELIAVMHGQRNVLQRAHDHALAGALCRRSTPPTTRPNSALRKLG